ncbi:hypothetical protein SUGI_1027620 [Cryptomeria japonica]|nr:hypothetical protein SUGI_1027620 [Cryptomeria japonica]
MAKDCGGGDRKGEQNKAWFSSWHCDKKIDVANRVSRALCARVIWINFYLVVDKDAHFGGYKMSGIGRENGLQVLQNYLQVKPIICPLHESPWL